MLDGVVALDVQGERLGAEEPGNALGAGRGGQGAAVLVDTVGVQVLGETREVQTVGGGVSARGSNVIDVSEDAVEERERVAELGQLEDEADDGDGTS